MADLQTYFCAEADPTKLVASVAQRVADVAKNLDYANESNAYQHLFGDSLRLGSQSLVVRTGDDGQLVKIRVNKAKALLESLVGLILGPPLTWRPSARNSNVEVRSSILMASNLLEYFWKQDGMGVFCGEWIKHGLAFRAAYAFPEWSPVLGAAEAVDYSAEGGQLLFGGGLRVRCVMPWDVFFDQQYRSWAELPWVCFRTHENKFDLAALEPDEKKKQAILAAGPDWLRTRTRVQTQQNTTDVIPVYRFQHRPSPACPDGLELQFIDGQCGIGTPAKCSEITLERFAPGVRADSPLGDSQWQSTLGIQELTDSVHSSVASNFNALATQAVSMDSRDNISRDRVNNLMVFETGPGREKPQGLQLTRNPEGFDKWLEMMASAQTDIVGLNDVQQGSPDTAQMNAQAFALLASMAVQRNGATQRRALDSIGRLGGKVVRLLAENMTEETAVQIAGRAARLNYPLQTVEKSKLSVIGGCFVEVGNALEQTASGRLQILQLRMQANPNLPPEDMQQIIETGRSEQAMNVERDEDLFIQWENDEILAGRTPIAHITDDHLKHARKHRCTTLTPAARKDKGVIEADAQHLLMHYREYWGTPEGVDPRTDPQFFDRLRVLLGQQPPSSMGPPPGMGAPPAAGAPQPKGGPPSDQQAGAPAAIQSPEAPRVDLPQPEAPPTVLQ